MDPGQGPGMTELRYQITIYKIITMVVLKTQQNLIERFWYEAKTFLYYNANLLR